MFARHARFETCCFLEKHLADKKGSEFMPCHECLRQIFPDASEEYLSELLELRSFKTKEMATGDLPPEAVEMILDDDKTGVKEFMEKNAKANAGAKGYNAELSAEEEGDTRPEYEFPLWKRGCSSRVFRQRNGRKDFAIGRTRQNTL